MQIKNHRLTEVDFVRSPNQSGLIKPKFLVIHFTAGRDAERSIQTLTRKSSKVSAHLLISRTGKITQMVDFNKKAWHAGTSFWKTESGEEFNGLNAYSIGIELENYGSLTKTAGGQWVTYFGRVVPDNEVIVAKHKHGGHLTGWHRYTEEQLDALETVSELLFDKYNLEDVLGHEDIAPRRKTDPGPSFKMDSFRASLVGRDDSSTEHKEEGKEKHEIFIPDFLKFNPFA